MILILFKSITFIIKNLKQIPSCPRLSDDRGEDGRKIPQRGQDEERGPSLLGTCPFAISIDLDSCIQRYQFFIHDFNFELERVETKFGCRFQCIIFPIFWFQSGIFQNF